MKLAIFGATGKTGIPLVKQALAKGHSLKCLVRNENRMPTIEQKDKVTVIVGNALDAEKVDQTIAGTDAVLNVLGHASGSPSDILTKSTKLILDSMRQHKVKLLIVLSMESANEKEDPKPSGYQKFSTFLTRLSISSLFDDSANQAKLIQQVPRDELDYIIIRGPRLTNGEYTGKYRTANYFPYGMYITSTISRSDVADFILKLLETKEFRNRCPCIMY